MVQSNYPFLKNELSDIARLFTADLQSVEINVNVSEEGNFLSVITSVGFFDRRLQSYFSVRQNPTGDDLQDKRNLKRTAKTALYNLLSRLFQRSFPYGALTGIRPVKLLKQLRTEGKDAESYMTGFLKVKPYKMPMLLDIEKAQERYLSANEREADLYIGIPFCKGRCNYCSFVSCDIDKAKPELVENYVTALIQEIRHAKTLIENCEIKLRSAYIGGGTPSSLSLPQIEQILSAAAISGIEYTFEAGRPDSINRPLLELLKKYGVNRISVNPQTVHDKTLQKIGRRHTYKDFLTAFSLAKEYDFVLNTDLIMGLDGENYSDFKETLQAVSKLSPECITVHTLSLKSGSILKEDTERLYVEDIGKMSELSYSYLKEQGYIPYYTYRQKYTAGNLENTGYSKQGYACIYNIDNMEEICSCIACGGGAISKIVTKNGTKIDRYANPKDIATYTQKLTEICSGKDKLYQNFLYKEV